MVENIPIEPDLTNISEGKMIYFWTYISRLIGAFFFAPERSLLHDK